MSIHIFQVTSFEKAYLTLNNKYLENRLGKNSRSTGGEVFHENYHC